MSATTMWSPSCAPDPDPNRWVGVAELADLGFGSPWTVREHIRQGIIPAVKVGGQWRVRLGDLPRPVDARKNTDAHLPVEAAEAISTLSEVERRTARRVLTSLLQAIT